VDHEAAVAEESSDALLSRSKVVKVKATERIRSDLAVLACQVTNLAGLREVLVAGRVFAALKRIQVCQRRGTVTIARNWGIVDVVRCEMSAASFLFHYISYLPWRTHKRDHLLWGDC